MRYFENVNCIEDVKQTFRKWAMELHPDKGGNAESFKEMMAEYERMYAKYENIYRSKDGGTYRDEEKPHQTASEYSELINELIKLHGIEIEIIGTFIWITGDTKPHKETLKELGFKWSKKKAAWYKSPAGYKRMGKKFYALDEIRGMYGVQGHFTGSTNPQLTA